MNLKVNIGGLELKNPFILASSDNTRDIKQIKCAEENGASAVVLKAMLPSGSDELNSMLRVYVDAKEKTVYGTAGANRLTYDEGVELVRSAKKETGIKIGINIPLFVLDDYSIILNGIKRLADAGADFVELNYKPMLIRRPAITRISGERSFNVQEEEKEYEEYIHDLLTYVSTTTRIVRNTVAIPIMAKLAPDGVDEVALSMAAERGGADVIDVTGSLGGAYNIDIYNNGFPRIPYAVKSFFQINGAALKPFSQAMVARIAKTMDIPIIGTGGLTSWTDAVEMIMFGAHAVSFCALLMIKGFEALKEIDTGLREFMKQQGYESLDDFRGVALQHMSSSMGTCEFKPGIAKIDKEKCTGCGLCLKPAHCLATYMRDGKAAIIENECLGCGTCILICPAQAVTLVNK
jgi:dihydroorotate dehydrogenase/Pyruvate/2-oxoacid:ferredoxin oxidoreductase delta subunit